MSGNPAVILCVDDEENQLLLRKFVLQQAGYRVVTANSFHSALELFQSQRVDLALVDYWMSGGNGLLLSRELKARNKMLPVLILSAYAELPGETIGIADGWITKGAPPERLLAKVAELLQDSSQERSARGAAPLK